jgi:hypothetical protein
MELLRALDKILKRREENTDIHSIVDASRFDSSNPRGELPGTGLINQTLNFSNFSLTVVTLRVTM